MGGVRWDGEALQSPTQAQASILGRAPRYMGQFQPNSRRRIGGRRQSASLGLFTLSPGGGGIRDEARAKLKGTSDCVSSRQPIAKTFGSEH